MKVLEMPLRVIAATLLAGALVGCSDDDATPAPADTAGQAQIQADVSEDQDQVQVPDAGPEEDLVQDVDERDLPVITEVEEWVDLSYLEIYGPETDSGPDTDVLNNDAADGDLADVDEDAAGPDAEEDSSSVTADAFLGECEALGIPAAWKGNFDGQIEYDMDTSIEGVISEGIIMTNGELRFDISCVDSKLIVTGALDGVASVAGQGEFPFILNLLGYYSPSTGQLNATMTDGEVSIYDVLIVYFVGNFDGELQPQVCELDGAPEDITCTEDTQCDTEAGATCSGAVPCMSDEDCAVGNICGDGAYCEDMTGVLENGRCAFDDDSLQHIPCTSDLGCSTPDATCSEPSFAGTWDGESTGTNTPQIQGTAFGNGVWTAEEKTD